MNIKNKKNRSYLYDETYFKGNTIIHIVEPKVENIKDIDKILEKYYLTVFKFLNRENLYRRK